SSTRLYMLHGRCEPLEDEAPRKITVILRHYLVLVVNAKHRRALTRLLLSQHPLAVERMRYKQRYHRVHVPRDMRRCHFGCAEVETVEHALFFCRRSEELEDCRQKFIKTMQTIGPRLSSRSPWNATTVLKSLIFRRGTVCQTAKFAHKMFAIFEKELMV
ncbi:hypothetical protein C8R45DRAFT_822685, partial [Mycena sanguinolenta]